MTQPPGDGHNKNRPDRSSTPTASAGGKGVYYKSKRGENALREYRQRRLDNIEQALAESRTRLVQRLHAVSHDAVDQLHLIVNGKPLLITQNGAIDPSHVAAIRLALQGAGILSEHLHSSSLEKEKERNQSKGDESERTVFLLPDNGRGPSRAG